MKLNRNPKLRVFADSVLAYLYTMSLTGMDVTVNYNAAADVYWFVRSSERHMLENKHVQSLEQLDAIPRMAQLGVIGNAEEAGVDPFLFVFFNERGTYSKGIPHSLPTANCAPTQAKIAAKVIYHYLATGSFTSGLTYGVMRSLGGDSVVLDMTKPKPAAPRPVQKTFQKVNRDISELDLSKRILNILYTHDLYYIERLTNLTEGELMEYPGMGVKTVDAIKLALARENLILKTSFIKRRKK